MKSNNKILFVHTSPPFSPWTNSGASQAICNELARRNLLSGAMAPDIVSQLFRSGANGLSQLVIRLAARLPGRLVERPYWGTEKDGSLGRALRALPPGSCVIYVFRMPVIDPALKVRRFLFLNLSLNDAIREDAFDHGGLDENEILSREKEQRRMFDCVDGVVTPSTYAAHSIHRDFGVPTSKITPFGYGSTLTDIGTVSDGLSRFNKPKILFCGRDWHRKNGPVLFDSFLLVKRAIPDAELWIVGPGHAQVPVEHPGVKCFGFIDKTTKKGMRELVKIYKEASVFCMPTGCEPWGLVFTEAVALGLPIVGLHSWSLPDIVEDGVTGVLVDELCSLKLSNAIIDLHKNPEALLEMSNAAVRRYNTVLDWKFCVGRMLSRVMPEAVSEENVIPMQ